MKKSLIALAVAGALATPMIAQADATLYGSFRVVLENADGQDLNLRDDSTRIGIKGDVDLGLENTKGLFHWEANLSTADSNQFGASTNAANNGLSGKGKSMFGERLSYLGATGPWGTALVGRQYHPHYLWINLGSTGAGVLNSLVASAGEWGFLGNQSDGAVSHKRVDNTVAYISPVMNGFQFIGGAVVAGTGDDSADDVDGYNVAAKYHANGLTLAASFAEVDAIDRELLGLSAKYTTGALTLAARYEDREVGTSIDSDVIEVSGAYKVADNTKVTLRFTQKEVNDVEGELWAAAVERTMGKGRIFAEIYEFDSGAESSATEMNASDRVLIGYRVDF
ncbi:porin [Neptuniibacter sp.]|uniref:porin n=1 Tax=Neptuniibacter sp. TaxID=1962643 RepID=UPI00260F7B79|nr:porin [Neptuniibacter sp.]MCP4595967.1 porin [Neptuniibacter sp.]